MGILKRLLLRRNTPTTATTRASAKTVTENAKANFSDGELFIGRYYENSAEKTFLGVKQGADGTIQYFDPSSTDNEIASLKSGYYEDVSITNGSPSISVSSSITVDEQTHVSAKTFSVSGSDTTYVDGRYIDISGTNNSVNFTLPIWSGTPTTVPSTSPYSGTYSAQRAIVMNSTDNIALGDFSLANGIGTSALGRGGHSEGIYTMAFGENCRAEGYRSIAYSPGSHAEGSGTTAYNPHCHAEGSSTFVGGVAAHAEGKSTVAFGNFSHSEGLQTVSYGLYSHAEGYKTTAVGLDSHAEGNYTVANGDYSHTEGNNTKTVNAYEHANGQYNSSVSGSAIFGDSGNTLFTVGNGTSDATRKNALDIRQNGDIYFNKYTDTDKTGMTSAELQDELLTWDCGLF